MADHKAKLQAETVKTSIPPEHDFAVASEAEWEDAVFQAAQHFSVFIRAGRFDRRRTNYATFPEAAIAAHPDPRALVYAVTESGRSVCLVRTRWAHYLNVWKQMHPGDVL